MEGRLVADKLLGSPVDDKTFAEYFPDAPRGLLYWT